MKFISNLDTVEEPSFITFWCYIHFLAGIFLFVLLYYIGMMINSGNPKTWLIIVFASIIHIMYECKDIYKSYISKSPPKSTDSIFNSIGDQLCATLGIILASFVMNKSVSPRDVLYVGIAYCNVFLLTCNIGNKILD